MVIEVHKDNILLVAVCMIRLDVRAESIFQTFSELKSEVRALYILPPNHLIL